MNRQRMHSPRPLPMSRHWLAAPAAFLATMLALPVNAGISIPEDPLTSAARVAPNILLILDDSGSMVWQYMYGTTISKITGGDVNSGPTGINTGNNSRDNLYGSDSSDPNGIYDQTYITNSVYYNPANTYLPWTYADGERLTGGTSYTSAYTSNNYVASSQAGTSSGTTNLSNSVRTFYVPKDTESTSTTYLSNVYNYYRYQITGNDVVRSIYGNVSTSSTTNRSVSPSSGTVRRYSSNTHEVATVPAGAILTISIKSTLRTVLYVVNDPNGNTVCDSSVNQGDTSTCTVDPTVAGKYEVVTRRWNNTNSDASYNLSASYYTTNRCGDGSGSKGWINCEYNKTPTGRSIAAEQENFATWFSYHRTRIKAAKAGASDAFKPLGKKVRVGFWTIWNRNNFDIPVDDGNDGRFVNNENDPITPEDESTTSRNKWYNSLYGAAGSGGTPLQNALDSAGTYYSSEDATGPYGPQLEESQYSCRQNFAILTTDGLWNTSTVDVNNQDNSDGVEITGPKDQSYKYVASNPYKDGYEKTLADIAMKYWKTDLRDLINNVPSSDANPAFWQHMVTFGISIGLAGKKGWKSVEDVPANPNWANVGDVEDEDRIDDLLHAAVNGHGAFVSAASPDEFTRGLKAALATIAQRTSSYSNVATNAASLRTGGQVFNASYVSGIWSGAVKAWNLDGPGGKPGTQKWSATIPAWGSRKIFTYQGTGTTFPTSTQLASLARTGGPVNYPVSGLENANYLKGKQSLEGSNVGDLRIRTSILGDIVGSSPAYVEDTKTLYVGANDGMLHAFSATNGVEQFAYVPGIINFNNLGTLSSGDYTHKFFVDGPIVVSDRKLTPGKNLLAGALGRGGKGMYFLDVSDPSTFSTSKVTTELAETPNGNMGLVLGRPILAKVKAGNVAAAVFGNGVNSSSDKAVLIVANLATGAVIGEIDTGVGSSSTPNGLSAPTGVVGPDGKTLAYVYAGDLLGNVWKFNIKDSNPGNWTKTLLFTAKLNETGAAQPITSSVTVALDPSTYKRWVLFGTGSFLTVPDADNKTPLAQSMYGFVDSDAAVAYTDLKKRTIINTGQIQDGFPVRSFESKQDLPATKKGWYVNLPGDGERIVQDSQMVSNILVTASMLPTGDACEASGSGYINAVDAFTGTSAGKSFFDLDGDGDTSDTNVGGVPVGSVNFGVGMPTLPLFLDGRLIVGGTGGDNGGGEKPGTGGIVRKTWSRVSWREIKRD